MKLFFYPTFCQKAKFLVTSFCETFDSSCFSDLLVSVKLLNLVTRKKCAHVRYFKTESFNTLYLRWNSRTFGIVKWADYVGVFEACQKKHFSSFKNEYFRTFSRNCPYFLGIKIFFWHFKFFFEKIWIFLPYNFDPKWDLPSRNPILTFLQKHLAVSDQFQKTDLKLFETVKVSLKLVTKKRAFLA